MLTGADIVVSKEIFSFVWSLSYLSIYKGILICPLKFVDQSVLKIFEDLEKMGSLWKEMFLLLGIAKKIDAYCQKIG